MNGKSVLLCLAAIALLLWPLAGIAEENDMTGIFDFENRTVLLNSGYTMPILGLGTYALDHDTWRQFRDGAAGKRRQTHRHGLHVRQ